MDNIFNNPLNMAYTVAGAQELPNCSLGFILNKKGISIQMNNYLGKITATLTENMKIPGLPEVEDTFQLNMPKIPFKFYNTIVNLFREVYAVYKTEALVELYYNPINQDFKLHIPKQEVTSAGVYRDKEDLENPGKDYILFMDIHSHNVMSAFWSGIDDADEHDYKLYGVIGDINNKEPSCRFRVCYKNTRIDLERSDIFTEINDEVDNNLISNWKDKIKEKSWTYPGQWQNYNSDVPNYESHIYNINDDPNDVNDLFNYKSKKERKIEKRRNRNIIYQLYNQIYWDLYDLDKKDALEVLEMLKKDLM